MSGPSSSLYYKGHFLVGWLLGCLVAWLVRLILLMNFVPTRPEVSE